VLFNEWIARDFDRAFNIIDGNYIPLAGPELTNGGRLPGPFMYIFLAIPLLIKYSYEALFAFNFLLNIASIIGLFVVLKKYCDVYIAGITTGLVSINLLSIMAVAFPINPSFLFPFVTLFIWLLLEFALKRNTKVVPFIALILVLAVQFHYSIATYIPIPISIWFLFRIRVPKKTLLASMLITSVCLVPYQIHKAKFDLPKDAGSKGPISKRDITNPFVAFKVITLIHSFEYLSQIRTENISGPGIPKKIKSAMNIITQVSFYVLLLTIVYRVKNGGWLLCKKEIITLILFWFPAFLYGWINPTIDHPWYVFIFIVPQSLLIATAITTIYHLICPNRFYGQAYIAIIFFLSFAATLSTAKHTKAVLTELDDLRPTSERDDHFVNGTYKHAQIMLSALLEKLRLRPDEFYEKVYFFGYKVLSKRRLESLVYSMDAKGDDERARDGLDCFYISNHTYSVKRRRILAAFLNDTTIRILSTNELSLRQWGISQSLKIYKYRPLQQQSCYNNTFNPFVTTALIRDMLIASKKITSYEDYVGFKILGEKTTYDSDGNLELMEGSYVVNNKSTASPFRFGLKIKNTEKGYTMRGTMALYAYYGAFNYDISKMDVVIEKRVGSKAPREGGGNLMQLSRPTVTSNEISILVPQTLANYLNSNDIHSFNYNQRWFKESSLKMNLEKGGFNIYLKWSVTKAGVNRNKEYKILLYEQFQGFDP
jgi:hypothetical protein